jgi:hypothetical protein
MAFNSNLFTTFNNGITLLASPVNVLTVNSNTIYLAPSGINNFSFNPLLNLSTINSYIDYSYNCSNVSVCNCSEEIIDPTVPKIYNIYDPIQIENASFGNNKIFIPQTTNQIGYKYMLYNSLNIEYNLEVNTNILTSINIPIGVWILEFSAIAQIKSNTIVLSLSTTEEVDNTKLSSSNIFNAELTNYNLNFTTVITCANITEFNIIGTKKILNDINVLVHPKVSNINIYITRLA